MIASRPNLAAVLLAGIAQTALVAAPAHGQAQQSIAIAAQPLDAALQQLMAQTGVLVSYPSSLSAGKRSSAVAGETAAIAALSRLLEGTGLTYRQTGANSFTLELAPEAPGDAIQLGAVRVEGGNGGGRAGTGSGDDDRAAAADRPYRTPGSVSHVRREQIDRVPPSSTGDIFLSVPGVISAGNRNGQSLDLNIRGLQGMGRVATLIDGAQQQTSMYRGYGGTSSRTFIDPDLIGGIDISKGPSDSAYGGGAMGGVVNMRTLIASDLVGDENGFGVRLKAGIADNSIEPPKTGVRTPRFGGNGFTTDARNLSLAFAYRSDAFEVVGAFVERRNGNYFAGTKGNDRTKLITYPAGTVSDHPISKYVKGGEVFNTSRDTQAALLKATARFGDGHALELGYVRYDSTHGEEYPDANNPFSTFSWIEQAKLSDVVSNVYTAKYRWKPSGTPLIDLRIEPWLTKIDDYWGGYDLRSKSTIKGLDARNTSLIGTGIGELSLTVGGQYSVEDASARRDPPPTYVDNMAFEGRRQLGRVYANAALNPADGIALSGGLSYEFFRTKGSNLSTRKPPNLRGERLNPRAALTVTPIEGVQLFVNYAEGWRPATLRETLLDMEGLIQPNPLLRPERSQNVEYGVNVLREGAFVGGDRLKAKVAYFDNRYSDFIMREYGTSFGLPNAYRSYTNVPQVHFRGLEFSLEYAWRNLFFEGQLSRYTNIKFCLQTNGNNNYPPCTQYTYNADYGSESVPPKFAGSVTLGARFFSDRLTLGARSVFAGERAVGRYVYYGGAVQSEWSPYTVLDLFGSFDINDKLSLSASVENVTDRYYLDALTRARSPSPGRLFRLGVTGRLGGPKRESRPSAAAAQPSYLGAFDGNWAGGYVGVASGFSDIEGKTTVTKAGGALSNEGGALKDDGIGYVLFAGHNWQVSDGLVMGVEADFGRNTPAGHHISFVTENTTLANAGSTESRYSNRNLWQASLRGRLGHSFGRLLLFGTGGIALRRDSLTRTQFIGSPAANQPSFTVPSFDEKVARTHTGWVAGLGGEFAISRRWSLRAEYLRSDFGAKTYDFRNARLGVMPDYIQRTIARDPITNAIRRDPVTNAIIYIETPISRSATTIEGRKASKTITDQAVRIGLTYRF